MIRQGHPKSKPSAAAAFAASFAAGSRIEPDPQFTLPQVSDGQVGQLVRGQAKLGHTGRPTHAATSVSKLCPIEAAVISIAT